MRLPSRLRGAGLRGSTLLAVASLIGCGPTYQFTPPPTQIGQVCTMQCQTSADQCRSLKSQEYQQCQWRRDMEQRAYDSCVATNGAMACSGPTTMCLMPNTSECDARFRTCYQACGGTVTEVKEK